MSRTSKSRSRPGRRTSVPAGAPGPANWSARTGHGAADAWADAVAHLGRADPALARVIAGVGPCRLAPDGGERPFEALVETITYQQLSGKAAQTIFGRVTSLFPRGMTPRSVLRVPVERLRGAGLSAAKTAAIQDLARAALDGRLRADALATMPAEELERALLSVRGIGPWSVHMFLIFRLGHPDVWPVTDLGIRKAAGRIWNLGQLPAPSALADRGEPLRPWRSVASWYLWRSLELPRDGN